jgi:hypothetical protein
MKRCDCRNLSNCPFQRDYRRMTYPHGTPIYRPLTDDEEAEIAVRTKGRRGEVYAQRGDFIGSDGKGHVTVLGRAIDPDRAVAYAEARIDKKCRADSMMWRAMHPYPGEKGLYDDH